MKIYASVTTDILNKYMGQDVWLRCSDYGDEGYVRILSKPEGDNRWYTGMYLGNIIYDRNIEDGDFSYMFVTVTIHATSIRISEPVRPCTSADIWADYVDNSAELDRFIGKNIWVLAEDLADIDDTPFYIKIHSKKDNSIRLSLIDASFIDGSSCNYDEFTWDTAMYWLSRTEVMARDEWDIVTPIDILTDEEILECLEQHRGEFAEEDE